MPGTNFRLAIAEPTGPTWAGATPSERAAFYREYGRRAIAALRDQLGRGLDRFGAKMPPRRRPRADRATGPPLLPHLDASRTAKRLRFVLGKGSLTVYWSHGWGKILEYHGEGLVRGAPVRDVRGLAPKREGKLHREMAGWWAKRHRGAKPSKAVGPLPYGPSQARVRHLDYDPEDITAAGRRLFGRDVSPQDLASAVGAPNDAIVDIAPGYYDIKIYVRGPGYEAARTIKRTVLSEELVIENEYFGVDSDKQGQGIGAAVFGRQVEQAARLGVARIETSAARSGGFNGYYTWPRFGYDGPLPGDVRESLPIALEGIRQISDLMRTEEGRAWWKENGQTIHLSFDLAEGSLSRRVWDGYRAEKAAARSKSRTSLTGT